MSVVDLVARWCVLLSGTACLVAATCWLCYSLLVVVLKCLDIFQIFNRFVWDYGVKRAAEKRAKRGEKGLS